MTARCRVEGVCWKARHECGGYSGRHCDEICQNFDKRSMENNTELLSICGHPHQRPSPLLEGNNFKGHNIQHSGHTGQNLK